MGPDSASEVTLEIHLENNYVLLFSSFQLQICLKSSQLSAIASFRICNIVDSNELVGVVLVLMFIYFDPARIKGLLDKLAVL
jgi:hypothetical protein